MKKKSTKSAKAPQTKIGNARRRALVREKPSETDAAVAVAQAWLSKAGFHEDPAGDDPARIEIQGPGWEGRSHEHYVDVRIYVPALDIEHVVDGTHPDGITVEAA